MKATALLLCGLCLTQPLFSEESNKTAVSSNVQCSVQSYGFPLIQGVAIGRMLIISIKGSGENTLFRNEKIINRPAILRQGKYSLSVDNIKLKWDRVTDSYLAMIDIPEEWTTTQPYSIELPLIHAPEGTEVIVTALEKEEKESITHENYILHYGDSLLHGNSDSVDFMVRYKEINPILELKVLKNGKPVEAFLSKREEIYDEHEHYSEEELKKLPLAQSGYLSIYTSYEDEEEEEEEEDEKQGKEKTPKNELQLTLLKGTPSWETFSIEIPAVSESATASDVSTHRARPVINVTSVLKRSSSTFGDSGYSDNDLESKYNLLFNIQNEGKGIYVPTDDSSVTFAGKSDDYDYTTFKDLEYFIWDTLTGKSSFSTNNFNSEELTLRVNQRIDLEYCADGLVKARVASGDESGVWKHGSFELPYTLTRTPNSVRYSFASKNDANPYYQLRFLDKEGNILLASNKEQEIDSDDYTKFNCTLPETAASVEFYYMPVKPTEAMLQLKIPQKK